MKAFSLDCRNLYLNEEVSGTLQAKSTGGFSYNFLNPILKENHESIRNRESSERQPCEDRYQRDCADAVVTDGNRREQHAVRPYYFYESRFAEWKPYDVGSIRAEGGSCGNGSEGLVCYEFVRGGGVATTLDSCYYKGCGLREGIEREYVMMKAHATGNGQLDNSTIDDKTVGTLDCMHDQKMVILEDDEMENKDRKYVLRRLTPMECARLQGFPDWWCDGANGSDSAMYRLWGNGVALPCVAFIMERIANGGKRYEGE